jgi:hypothetical protein
MAHGFVPNRDRATWAILSKIRKAIDGIQNG